MNRRSALKSFAAIVATLILPAPRRQIDLRSFCAKEGNSRLKYDMTLPYEVGDNVYATDSRVCVRVRPQSGDVATDTVKMPPFESLTWNHDSLRGWSELKPQPGLLCSDANCPACDGAGYEGGVMGFECICCDGYGKKCTDIDDYVTVKCKPCEGRGIVAPPGIPVCANCRGKAVGVFPAVVCINGQYFDAKYYDKVRRLGGEFVVSDFAMFPLTRKPTPQKVLKFRFSDGGLGLLMGMDREAVETRLVGAKS